MKKGGEVIKIREKLDVRPGRPPCGKTLNDFAFGEAAG